MHSLLDANKLLKELTLDEKIRLLAGKDTWSTHPVERLNIPSITTTDGPHGARGTKFFNGPRGALLPSATAMGATFDTALMHEVGTMLAAETKEKGCDVLLGPTVCLQRSPLLGRGFEAFAEDPVLSGTLASAYINGLQEHGVAASIKHFAAHDQSYKSPEDYVHASERTLREMHLLPFQLAAKHARPWSFMASYHRINGVHTSEDPWLLDDVLRKDWGWDGLVMSDWFGNFSTAEAVNAGLDLEMPGPTRWRGSLLKWSVMARKIKVATIDERVRNLLNTINRIQAARDKRDDEWEAGDTQRKRDLCRQVARSSVVLLKNEVETLPLDPTKKQTYGLIGPGVLYPSLSGGGSADLFPYHASKPIDAIRREVGEENVKTATGCYGHLNTPLLSENITIPGTDESGFLVEWFNADPQDNPDITPLETTTTTQAQMYLADSKPDNVPDQFWIRVRTTYTATMTTTVQFGLCVIGSGRLFVDGREEIDLWTSKPEKTRDTPMFNQASMESTADLQVEEGRTYELMVIVKSSGTEASVGAMIVGGLRIGSCEKIDPVTAIDEAVELAKRVDVPIVIAGLNADYETEASDRKHLSLPPGIDELIERVAEANPKTIVVTQAGCPFTMPWIEKVSTLVHAWFGGQETGNAIADVLFGHHNPSGRLSVTFPKRLEDTPAFLTFGKGSRDITYGEGVYLGYRYYEKLRNDPLFYFGYGLSYTTFQYANLRVPSTVRIDGDANADFEVLVDVTNTGDWDGFETVQVYIQDVECAQSRPRKELKGFAKVWVETRSTATAVVKLDKYALSYWDEEARKWHAEKGTFKVIVSRSADPKDEVLAREFELGEDYYWSGV